MPEKVPQWTKTERRILLNAIGSFGMDWLRRKTGGRSADAVYAQIRRYLGGGGITRGTYSLRSIMAETGYSESQLRRAGEALAQRWARTAKNGQHLISEEQLEEIVDWLLNDFWVGHLHLYCCIECGGRDRDHKALGLCDRCYFRVRRYGRHLGLGGTLSEMRAAAAQLVGKKVPDPFWLDRMQAYVERGRGWSTRDMTRIREVLDGVPQGRTSRRILPG